MSRGNLTPGQREGEDWQGEDLGCAQGECRPGSPILHCLDQATLVALHLGVLTGWDGMARLGMAGTSPLSWWRKWVHFNSPARLLSAAELQPALLAADVRKPAVQWGVSAGAWQASRGLAPMLLGSALLHSSLLLPDRDLGAPKHRHPTASQGPA